MKENVDILDAFGGCPQEGCHIHNPFSAFWYWVEWSNPDVSCPNCGSYKRHQDEDALDHGYSILVCEDCGYREFDD